jgi:quinohemoprotein ethanol dehydrogenase
MMIAAENRNTYTKSALMTEFVSHALSTTIAFMLLLASGASAAASIDDAALANEQNTEDWLGYGRTYSEQRFSPLEQVSAKTVEKLSVDWFVDLPDAVGLVATPLVADGIMYFVSSRNIVYAVEATSGRELWRFDPKVAEVSGRRMRVSYLHGSRGVALWDDKVLEHDDGGSRKIALYLGRTKSIQRQSADR